MTAALHQLPEAQRAEVERMAANVEAMLAGTITEERHADAAFSELWSLRDKLVRRDFNTAACRVDEAIEALQAACREFVK